MHHKFHDLSGHCIGPIPLPNRKTLWKLSTTVGTTLKPILWCNVQCLSFIDCKIYKINFIAFQFDDDFNNQDDEYVSETSDYPSASDSEKHNDGNAVAVKDDSKVTVCFNLKCSMWRIFRCSFRPQRDLHNLSTTFSKYFFHLWYLEWLIWVLVMLCQNLKDDFKLSKM